MDIKKYKILWETNNQVKEHQIIKYVKLSEGNDIQTDLDAI